MNPSKDFVEATITVQITMPVTEKEILKSIDTVATHVIMYLNDLEIEKNSPWIIMSNLSTFKASIAIFNIQVLVL